MKLLFFILLLFFVYAPVFAQVSVKEDSVIKLLQAAKNDTTKINSFIALVNMYARTNPELAVKYANEGIRYAATQKVLHKNADLYFSLGNAYNSVGNNDSAVLSLEKCIKLAEATKNITLQVKSLMLIGSTYTNQAKYKEAADVLFKALDLAQTSTDPSLSATVYSNLAVFFYNQSNYDKALAYGEKALEILKKDGDPKTLGACYLNLGLYYADIKNVVKAKNYYTNALALFKKIDAKLYTATTLGNLSLLEEGDINKKIDYLMQAQKIWDEVAPEYPNAIGNLGNLGSAYLAATDDTNFVRLRAENGIVKDKSFLLNKAEELLIKACKKCKLLKFDRDLHYFTGRLADVEEAKGNYKMANQHLREYIMLNDSIYSQENKNKIAEVEGERQVAIRDKEIQLNKLAISSQRKVRIALIAGLLLLSVIIIMFYRQSWITKRTNTTLLKLNIELDEANKVKARFFGIISHDLRSPVANLVAFLNVQQEAPELFSKEQADVHTAKITASAESLLETMEAMLQWSKSQMQNFKPQLKNTNITDIFQQVRSGFPDENNYTIRFDPGNNLSVTTDENYLKTILHNLTANAIKALSKTPQALITWKAFEEKGKVVLSITDNGPGAADHQVEALYNKEATVHSKNGLGLHIIRDLAAAIHCTVRFFSKEGKGTTFELTMN